MWEIFKALEEAERVDIAPLFPTKTATGALWNPPLLRENILVL